MKADLDYLAGLVLFEWYKHNPKISRMLRIGGATVKNRLTLSYELSRIAKHLAASEKLTALVKPPVTPDIQKPEQPLHPEVIAIDRLRSEQKMCYQMLHNLHAVLLYREIQERKEIALRILDIDDQSSITKCKCTYNQSFNIGFFMLVIIQGCHLSRIKEVVYQR